MYEQKHFSFSTFYTKLDDGNKVPIHVICLIPLILKDLLYIDQSQILAQKEILYQLQFALFFPIYSRNITYTNPKNRTPSEKIVAQAAPIAP